MKSPLIVKVEGAIAFLIPSLTVLGSSMQDGHMTYYKAVAYLCGASVAGLSGLKSFLSTTFSDSMTTPPVTEPEKQPTP